MAASSVDSLRDKLRVVLDREDKYRKVHNYVHERIRRIDRSLASPDTQSLPCMTKRHVRVKAVRRMERAQKTIKIQQKKRRELLARIIEMEIEIKRAGEDTKPEEADEDTEIKEPDEDTKTMLAGKSTKTKKASERLKAKRTVKQT